MNSERFCAAKNLLILTEEKSRCLQCLHESLSWFCDNIADISGSDVLLQLDKQSSIIEQINCINKDFKEVAQCHGMDFVQGSEFIPTDFFDDPEVQKKYSTLDLKLKNQNELIKDIAYLSKIATAKAQAISDELKGKIKQVQQQKNIITSYYSLSFDINQSGNLYDYKEGKRI